MDVYEKLFVAICIFVAIKEITKCFWYTSGDDDYDLCYHESWMWMDY